jgi:CheY-like chemotaxis protein
MTPTDLACLQGRCVMIAEDETLIAMAYEQMLGEHGCDVLGPAGTVAEALHLLRPEPGTRPPVAALLDIKLGGEPCDAVAARLLARGIPFLLVTGYAAPGRGSTLLHRAPRLQKPAPPEEVLRELARIAC